MSLISYLIILISTLFVFKNQRYLILIFSFTASTSDALISSEILSMQLPLFTRIMEMLIFAAAFVALWQNKNKLSRKQQNYIGLSLLFIGCTFLIALIKYGMELSLPEVFARIINFSVQYGPVIFILFLSTFNTFNFKRYLYIFLGSHMFLTVLVIYGPYIHFPYFEFLKYTYWHLDDYSSVPTTSAPLLIRGDLLGTLANKYLYFVDSCFHNANILGFYAGSFALIFLQDLLNNKRKLLSAIMFITGIIVWIDTGTKAPVAAMLLVIFVYYYKSMKKNAILAIALLMIILPVSVYALIYAYNNIFVDSINTSLESRHTLIVEELDFFLGHFFLGQTLKENIPSPHQLFLLYGISYGVFAMLISLLLMYLKPIMDTINNFSISALGLCSLLFFMSITDNFTAISLYMLLFAYLVYEFIHKPKSTPEQNGTIIA